MREETRFTDETGQLIAVAVGGSFLRGVTGFESKGAPLPARQPRGHHRQRAGGDRHHPLGERPRGAAARLREAAAPGLLGLLGLTGVGVGAVVGGVRDALAGVLPGALPGPTVTAVAAVAATLLDAVVVAALFRLLLPRAGTLRSHLGGAAVVAVGWAALRALGGAFVGTRVAAAGAVWGALAGVVTVLVLLHLLARLLLVGALVSALRHEARRDPEPAP